MKFLCASSQQNVHCVYEATYILRKQWCNMVRTAARERGWRKDFNSPELTLYIGSFRVQLRSVPRPTYTASTITAVFLFSLAVCPRSESQSLPYFSDSISH